MYYTTNDIDKTILLQIKGSEVDGKVWCVGVLKHDKTHRKRDFDGFYSTNELQQAK